MEKQPKETLAGKHRKAATAKSARAKRRTEHSTAASKVAKKRSSHQSTKAELPKDFNPADKATVMAAWIDERLKTSKGKELFKALPAVTPGARAKMLREAATQEGLAGCAFADFYAEYAK